MIEIVDVMEIVILKENFMINKLMIILRLIYIHPQLEHTKNTFLIIIILIIK